MDELLPWEETTAGYVPSVKKDHSTDTHVSVRTVTSDGRTWVEVDDAAWANAIQTDYINGIPMLWKR